MKDRYMECKVEFLELSDKIKTGYPFNYDVPENVAFLLKFQNKTVT